MMKPSEEIVVDTNVLVGLIDSQDSWHRRSVELRDALNLARARLLFFDCVINETISVLARRSQERRQQDVFLPLLDRLVELAEEDILIWVSRNTQQYYARILDLVRENSGNLNFHDGLIALACRDIGIEFIASFDRDFDGISWLTRVADPSTIAAGTK